MPYKFKHLTNQRVYTFETLTEALREKRQIEEENGGRVSTSYPVYYEEEKIVWDHI